jgi:hypothetical protein
MIYRRFGYVQARLLLERQDELRKLERRLDSFDQRMGDKDSAILRIRDEDPEDPEVVERKKLIDALQAKFLEYCTCSAFPCLKSS